MTTVAKKTPQLVEVDFIFRTHHDQRDPDFRLFKVRVSLNQGELYLSFDLFGAKGPIEGLMPEVLDQIQAGLDQARDPKLSDNLIELAETRAVARALRFAGVGVETVGFEELGAGEVLQGQAPNQNQNQRIENGNRGGGDLRGVTGRPQGNGGNGNGGHHTRATTAQRRAIGALSRQLGIEPEEAVAKVFPDINPDDLSLSQASTLIDKLKVRAGNGNGTGNGQTVHVRR